MPPSLGGPLQFGSFRAIGRRYKEKLREIAVECWRSRTTHASGKKPFNSERVDIDGENFAAPVGPVDSA